MRETYFTSTVRGSTLKEIKEAAVAEIFRFFGQDLPFAIDIEPRVRRTTVDGEEGVALYEATIRCRGFEV